MNTNTTPALQATNIHQSFGHVDALRGVNLTLMPGEIVALLGVNGAGKSTFLDIVLGLATPTQGDISVYGMSPREAVRRSLVSAMLQTGSMPRDGKVRNMIDLVAAMHANPIPTDELLERANLTKLAKRPLNKLSGGERQRVVRNNAHEDRHDACDQRGACGNPLSGDGSVVGNSVAQDRRVNDQNVSHREEGDDSAADFMTDGRAALGDLEERIK